jgi:hypothetical protein|tara:strand:+ start:181 stop:444 length:264 start_codon:yes stop_codon:yes gene_type:complete
MENMTLDPKQTILLDSGNRRETMNDVYELEEFMETPGGKGFVMTRKCPADQYENLIEKKVKQLSRSNKSFRVYVNTPEGDRELVNAS